MPREGQNNLFDIIKSSYCFKNYFNEYQKTNDTTAIKQIIKYSAKSYPDFGDEEGCIRKNNSFVLFHINFNITNSSNISEKSTRLNSYVH